MVKNFVANFKLENQNSKNVTFTLNKQPEITATFNVTRSGGSDKYYMWEQSISSNVWIIHHNLDKCPSITIVDEYNRRITGFAAKYIDNNSLEVYFKCAFKGRAYLN